MRNLHCWWISPKQWRAKSMYWLDLLDNGIANENHRPSLRSTLLRSSRPYGFLCSTVLSATNCLTMAPRCPSASCLFLPLSFLLEPDISLSTPGSVGQATGTTLWSGITEHMHYTPFTSLCRWSSSSSSSSWKRSWSCAFLERGNP